MTAQARGRNPVIWRINNSSEAFHYAILFLPLSFYFKNVSYFSINLVQLVKVLLAHALFLSHTWCLNSHARGEGKDTGVHL